MLGLHAKSSEFMQQLVKSTVTSNAFQEPGKQARSQGWIRSSQCLLSEAQQTFSEEGKTGRF